jgi:hypothetical protein
MNTQENNENQGNRLDDKNGIAKLSSREYYENELINLRIILAEYDRAILNVSSHKSYTLNTGQTTQTVTRQDLSALTNTRLSILNQIRNLEIFLGKGDKATVKVEPRW